jgi:colanic acid/amylovoran biosynthesis glycosyltransferase
VKVCYVINQYPMVSHSFIRREILALERQGAEVVRTALRGWDAPAVDAGDIQEKERTRYVLQQGVWGVMQAVLRAALRSPGRFFHVMADALALAKVSYLPAWKHLIYFSEACVVAQWVVDAQCDHIHAHFGTNSTDVALLAAALAAKPFSFTVHGPEEFDHPRELGLPLKMERAARTVAISQFGRSQLCRWATPALWNRLVVAHCGLDAMFKAMPETASNQTNTLVCVGRLSEQKGQLTLLQALRKVLDTGINCQLVLAGDGPLREMLEQQAAGLSLQNHIRITGWIDGAQVRREILAARAMILPSFAEGLPVVIMEALALSRPVISTYVAGIPELVLPGECGWLVPAGDVDQLAAAMLQCLQTGESDLRRMGDFGRVRALQRHDMDVIAAQLLLTFKDAVREQA